jgi:hypothetical protein
MYNVVRVCLFAAAAAQGSDFMFFLKLLKIMKKCAPLSVKLIFFLKTLKLSHIFLFFSKITKKTW